MKICIVCPSIYPDSIGGDTISIYLLSKFLKEHGHDVVAITFDSSYPSIEKRDNAIIYRNPGLVETSVGFRPKKSGNVFVDNLKDNEGFWVKVALVVKSVNRKEEPDVFHWYTFSPVPAIRWLTSSAHVATINTFWLTCVKGTNLLSDGRFCPSCNRKRLQYCLSVGIPPYGSIPSGLLSFARAKMLLWERRFAANQMDKLIALSYSTKSLLEFNQFSSAKIEVIPNMYDPYFLQNVNLMNTKPTGKIKEELGFDADSFIVSYVGRITQEKGVRYLIESIALVLKTFQNVTFALAGKGPEEASLKRCVKDLHVENHVRFMGFLDKDALAKLYSISGIMVAPQIVFEAFGRTVLEAMLAGRPVVTTSIGAPHEFIEHMKTGIIIPPRDSSAIGEWTVRLLGDDRLRQILGANARKYAENTFSPGNIGKRIERLYQSLL